MDKKRPNIERRPSDFVTNSSRNFLNFIFFYWRLRVPAKIGTPLTHLAAYALRRMPLLGILGEYRSPIKKLFNTGGFAGLL